MIVSRTCTNILAGAADRHREKQPLPLKAFRDTPAYVLLGDPGAGKTTAFEAECKALEDACLITARDFLTFAPRCHPEWRDKTLFIDGLDEVRVGADDARTPFDQIRGRLDELGQPRFRLSCREADWLGAHDRTRLKSISPDSEVTVLRLNPLTDSDIADILNVRPDIGDAREFIASARSRGVEGLLTNPQTLKMLADVVAQGRGWPDSRKRTFDMACRQMVGEHNEEHQTAQESNRPPAPELLAAAGHLCAVQLISGTAGYALRGHSDKEYPTLDQCDYASPEVLRLALATKLFKCTSTNHFAPVHRHIAEFLGARHLAEVIKSGLPARRVISLISGEDGTVVTEMRGLSAWLAAHSKDARADLIERDPIGVGLYGDIHEFSTDEKRALLESLNREASRLDSVRRMAAAFAALATPDMEPVLKAVLNDSKRDRDHQMFADFVLRVLSEGGPLPNFSELLLEIVRDDTRWSRVNYAALNAFIHNCADIEDKTSKLKALLADIHTGTLYDTDNELLGILLGQLYPQELPPSKVWDYLSEKGDPNFFGGYYLFWRAVLLHKSSDEQVAELLDNLQSRRPEHLPIQLLARGLKAHGDKLDTAHLYDWLNVDFAWDQFRDKKAVSEVRAWLEQRPEIQKAVILEGLSRCSEFDEFTLRASNVRKRLYDASLLSDFGLWCLKQAAAMADAKPHIAELMFKWAVQAHTAQTGNKGLSLKILRKHARNNEALKANLDQLLTPYPWELEAQAQKQKSIEAQRQQEDYWLNRVRPNVIALRENRAKPALLYKMADKYFGGFYRFSDDGPKAIAKLLRNDHELVDATLQGLRGVVDREDVPTVEEILGLEKRGRKHYLGWPFLAGLAEIERTAEDDSLRWDDRRIRTALAFYYSTSHADYRPKWYQRLLEARPEIVAEVQVQFAVAGFRDDNKYSYKLFELAHHPDHAQVARHASLPLLRSFPTRCKLEQIQSLDYLLWAALQYADRTSLQELIKKKLSRKSMNDAQRVHWLATGIIVSPRSYYNNLLKNFTSGREVRMRHLTTFFFSQGHVRPSLSELGIEHLELLIRLIGSWSAPGQWEDEREDTPASQASRFVSDLVQRLAASPTKDAGDALDRLLADPVLSRWHNALSRAQDTQRATWRDASYRHPTIEQVCQTLNGGTPANPGDLAALVMDRLDEIARKIRGGPTSDWRQYWNVDQYNHPICEKPENACRDNLLSDLEDKLKQLGIDAQPEGQYANGKRSDIRVSFRGFNVPVEIKRNKHRDLWSALRNQLIAQYTSAPDTEGYGIYLVFWFGKDRTQPPPAGTRPADAKELKERLQATLSPNEAHKISVGVIDVSQPARQNSHGRRAGP